MSVGAVVDTNSVASAMPYDGLIAVGGSPYGANAALNVSMALMLTGSEPRMTTTLLRSMSSSGAGTPRCAAYSHAKLGAAVTTRPTRDPADNARIQRSGRLMKAVGDISVEWPPYTVGKPIIERPI